MDLEEELEAMQQEQLDEQMLKTGTMPVSDQIQSVPAAPNGASKLPLVLTFIPDIILTTANSQRQGTGGSRGRRGGGAQKVAG